MIFGMWHKLEKQEKQLQIWNPVSRGPLSPLWSPGTGAARTIAATMPADWKGKSPRVTCHDVMARSLCPLFAGVVAQSRMWIEEAAIVSSNRCFIRSVLDTPVRGGGAGEYPSTARALVFPPRHPRRLIANFSSVRREILKLIIQYLVSHPLYTLFKFIFLQKQAPLHKHPSQCPILQCLMPTIRPLQTRPPKMLES